MNKVEVEVEAEAEATTRVADRRTMDTQITHAITVENLDTRLTCALTRASLRCGLHLVKRRSSYAGKKIRGERKKTGECKQLYKGL